MEWHFFSGLDTLMEQCVPSLLFRQSPSPVANWGESSWLFTCILCHVAHYSLQHVGNNFLRNMLAQDVQPEMKMLYLYWYLFMHQSTSVTFFLAQGCQLFLEFPRLQESFSPHLSGHHLDLVLGGWSSLQWLKIASGMKTAGETNVILGGRWQVGTCWSSKSTQTWGWQGLVSSWQNGCDLDFSTRQGACLVTELAT